MSLAGAGGYTSGILHLQEKTHVYIAIGGSGVYTWAKGVSNGDLSYANENRPKGGFNGGGRAASYTGKYSGAGSGGGATDLRVLENDLYHRIIVSGGGGGTDNYDPEYGKNDDGTGGSGGDKIAQGFWIGGKYNKDHIATQISGFSFGNGEAANQMGSQNPKGCTTKPSNTDIPGAGGGWFGGFSSQNSIGGAGGGSSFVLTSQSVLPDNPISVYNDLYVKVNESDYAFTTKSIYAMTHPIFVAGIWKGNGKAIITVLSSFCSIENKASNIIDFLFFTLIII